MSFYTIVSIGVGGFFGAVCRFLIASGTALMLGASFPYGTLLVNAVGSFFLGFLSRFLLDHIIVSELLRLGLLVGFLGAFTTFSTFSYETVILMQEGDLFKAAINVLGNTAICIVLCFLGYQLAKMI